jgi:hypothetical protein
MERIRETGFGGLAVGPSQSSRRGLAIRRQTSVIAVLAWIGLTAFQVYWDRRTAIPSLSWMLAPGLVFAISIATFRSSALPRVILKEGRDVGEIGPARLRNSPRWIRLNLRGLAIINRELRVCLRDLNQL